MRGRWGGQGTARGRREETGTENGGKGGEVGTRAVFAYDLSEAESALKPDTPVWSEQARELQLSLAAENHHLKDRVVRLQRAKKTKMFALRDHDWLFNRTNA